MARRRTPEPEPSAPLALNDVQNAVLPLSVLDAHDENVNTHPDAQIRDLMASLATFGQAQSISVWARPDGRYTIVGGHGLVTAARRAGWTEVKADILPVYATPAQIRAIMVSLNEHARHSVLDETRFAALLESSRLAGYDLHALGSSEEDLSALKTRLADAYLGLDREADEAEGSDEDDPDGASGWDGDDPDEVGDPTAPTRDQDRRDGPLGDEGEAGDDLAKMTLTPYAPRHVVSRGDVWWLSAPDCPRQHVLLCVDPHRDWPTWQPFLPRCVAEGVGEAEDARRGARRRTVIYAQFPDPLLPLSRRARHLRMVLVQPDRYLAGHLLDKVAEVWGEAALAREYGGPDAAADGTGHGTGYDASESARPSLRLVAP